MSSLATPPMERLPSVDEALRYPAVRLFVDRASSAHPGFSLSSANLLAVAQIRARFDGIPLARDWEAASWSVVALILILASNLIARRLARLWAA